MHCICSVEETNEKSKHFTLTKTASYCCKRDLTEAGVSNGLQMPERLDN